MNKDLEEAGRVLDIEARAITNLKKRLDERFVRAVDLLHGCEGKIIVTGMGKSGQVGRKISSTLSSTGSPSVFLHPAESSHGDLGIIASRDVIVAISYGGETPELQDLVRYAARKGVGLIFITGKTDSSLACAADVVLDVSVDEEACPLGLAPTASSTATLALGDALAMALLNRRGFREQDFAEYHPGGTLGRRLLTRVSDVMHTGESLPLVAPMTSMREVIALMTQKEVRGVAGVIDLSENLIGVVTDGDIRRRLEKGFDKGGSGSSVASSSGVGQLNSSSGSGSGSGSTANSVRSSEHNPLTEAAGDVMSKNPKTIDASELAEKALFMMEQFSIQTLFVVDRSGVRPQRPVGLLHLQDLIRAKIR